MLKPVPQRMFMRFEGCSHDKPQSRKWEWIYYIPLTSQMKWKLKTAIDRLYNHCLQSLTMWRPSQSILIDFSQFSYSMLLTFSKILNNYGYLIIFVLYMFCFEAVLRWFCCYSMGWGYLRFISLPWTLGTLNMASFDWSDQRADWDDRQ